MSEQCGFGADRSNSSASLGRAGHAFRHAVIVGGWDRGESDTGFFGIFLDVNLVDQYVYGDTVVPEQAQTLNVRSTRRLAPLPPGRLLDIAGESTKGRNLCEVIGDRQDGFTDEPFVATIEKGSDGSLTVLAIGTEGKVASAGVRQIGTIPKKDSKAWLSVFDDHDRAGTRPAIRAIASGYLPSTVPDGNRSPLVVQLDARI